MDTTKYTPEIREVLVKNIILSRGGNLHPKPGQLKFDVVDQRGETKEREVSSIHFTPGWKSEYYLYFYGLKGFCELKDTKEKERIFNYILESFKYPDICVYDKETLLDRLETRMQNISFISQHGDLDEGDWMMIDEYRSIIAKAHDFSGKKPHPVPGDIVEGAYYNGVHLFKNGLIETQKGWNKPISVCACPYTPFIHERGENEFALSVSGGPFFSFNPEDFEFIGKDTRFFCDWGHCGGCANGAVRFTAKVNRWKIKKGVEY